MKQKVSLAVWRVVQISQDQTKMFHIINTTPWFSGYVAKWCSDYHYCTTSFNLAWTQVLCRFKPYWRHVRNSWWLGSLTMIPAENKAKFLSLVYHTTKIIHHHHHIRNAWMRAIARPVLPKTFHLCSDHLSRIHLMKAKNQSGISSVPI